jgi:hypothetical protein
VAAKAKRTGRNNVEERRASHSDRVPGQDHVDMMHFSGVTCRERRDGWAGGGEKHHEQLPCALHCCVGGENFRP